VVGEFLRVEVQFLSQGAFPHRALSAELLVQHPWNQPGADQQHPADRHVGHVGEDDGAIEVDRERLSTIEGTVPSPNNQPKGCRFAPRCKFAMNVCTEKEPLLRVIAPGHRMACHLGDPQSGGAA